MSRELEEKLALCRSMLALVGGQAPAEAREAVQALQARVNAETERRACHGDISVPCHHLLTLLLAFPAEWRRGGGT